MKKILCDGGTFIIASRYLYPEIFHLEKLDFFFKVYLVAMHIIRLNSSFMEEKSISKIFEPSYNLFNFILPSHLCDFETNTSFLCSFKSHYI